MFYFLAYNMLMCFFIAFLLYLFLEAPCAALLAKLTASPDLDSRQSFLTTGSTQINLEESSVGSVSLDSSVIFEK